MALKPKHSLDEKPVERGRPFVGREDLIKIFKDAVRSKFSGKQEADPEPTVLVFHGVAGIGKTELRKKLAEELTKENDAAIWVVVDFYDPKNLIIENATFRLRMSLRKGKQKIPFPTFDLAYALYWKKSNPQSPLNKENFSLWGEAGLVSDVIAAAGEIPLVGFIPKVGQVIAKGSKPLKDWWKKRGSIALQMLPGSEPHEILEQLPVFLAEDIRNHFEKYRPPLVIFLDTYEAIWVRERELALRLSKDKWVRAFIERLPQGLFVITGREKLEWHKKEEENWKKYLTHTPVDRLAKKDAVSYLTDCGIANDEICQVIFKASKGVPLYLSLSVDTFEKIKKNQKREPDPANFGKTFYDIFESLIRNLNENETETLKVLSAARKWDRELFRLLVDKFRTGYPLTKTNEFHTFSFIESEGDRWKMHELMQKHLQEYQDEELRDKTHQFLFKHYNTQLEDVDVKKITETHKTALTEAFYHATNFMCADNLFGWVIKAVGVFKEAAQWQLLVPIYNHTISILQSAYGVEDVRVAQCKNNLALLYDSQGRYHEAELLSKRAIEIYKKALGEDHPAYATGLNNLAELYKAQGRYHEAEPIYKKAMEIDKKALGEDHPRYATDLNNLAGLHRAQGRYGEAEPLYKKAIEIDRKALGEDHPDYARDLNNLAELYDLQGRYKEAEPLYKKAMEIHKKVLGVGHPHYATHLNNLAALYYSQGRYDEAERLYKQSMEVDKKALGEDHPDYAGDLNNLAALYRAQGRYDEAELLCKKVIEIAKKALGEDHPHYATGLNNLASLYYSQGLYEKAERLFKKAKEINRKALGEDHPDHARDLNNLAMLYDSQERYDEAEPLYREAIEIGKKTLGEDHPSIATRLSNLAGLYHSQGHYKEAELLYKQAIEIDKKALNGEHPKYATCLNNLAGLYHSQGWYEEAEPLLLRALAILEKSLPPVHPNILTTLDNLAILYREWGKEAEARKYEKRAEEIRHKM